jgi:hypothetical protein
MGWYGVVWDGMGWYGVVWVVWGGMGWYGVVWLGRGFMMWYGMLDVGEIFVLTLPVAHNANTHVPVSASYSPSNHFISFMLFCLSSLLCRLCYVHCRTQFFHVDIFLFPVFMSHATSGFEFICTVTSCLKGHVLDILSEGVMADLNQNIDMTKLNKSYISEVGCCK